MNNSSQLHTVVFADLRSALPGLWPVSSTVKGYDFITLDGGEGLQLRHCEDNDYRRLNLSLLQENRFATERDLAAIYRESLLNAIQQIAEAAAENIDELKRLRDLVQSHPIECDCDDCGAFMSLMERRMSEPDEGGPDDQS